MTTIAIVNQKGGVGKTTTAVTMGHGLALRGLNVLVVDLDSQGNVADCLGLEPGDDLFRLLHPESGSDLLDVITSSGRPNLDVIRSDKKTAALKLMLPAIDFKEYLLARALADSLYDIVLLDCAPSVDILQTMAIVAADMIFVPTRLDQLALKGVKDVLQTSQAVQQAIRSPIALAGILPTFYDRVTRESHEQLAHLVASFGSQVLPPIPVDTNCRVMPRYGATLWERGGRSRAITGCKTSSGLVGGYAQALDRVASSLKEVVL